MKKMLHKLAINSKKNLTLDILCDLWGGNVATVTFTFACLNNLNWSLNDQATLYYD